MGQIVGKKYVPGPNDHHIKIEKTEDGTTHPVLHPGLGKDEPTDVVKNAARLAGKEHLENIQKELAAEAEELEGKAVALETKEQSLAEREAALLAREKELADREAALENGDQQ